MYLANRPQFVHRSVTWHRGGGGVSNGSRSIDPEHDGQDNGVPLRSFAIRFRACAGLYEAGRGLRIYDSDGDFAGAVANRGTIRSRTPSR